MPLVDAQTSLYQIPIFRFFEIWICDLPIKDHKRVVKFSDPPTNLLVPPAEAKIDIIEICQYWMYVEDKIFHVCSHSVL